MFQLRSTLCANKESHNEIEQRAPLVLDGGELHYTRVTKGMQARSCHDAPAGLACQFCCLVKQSMKILVSRECLLKMKVESDLSLALEESIIRCALSPCHGS